MADDTGAARLLAEHWTAGRGAAREEPLPPGLYIIGTPIGNLQDITLRALDTLKRVSLVLAEDTRHTRKLLNHFGIRASMLSYHTHNEGTRTHQVVQRLQLGEVGVASTNVTPSPPKVAWGRVLERRVQAAARAPPAGQRQTLLPSRTEWSCRRRQLRTACCILRRPHAREPARRLPGWPCTACAHAFAGEQACPHAMPHPLGRVPVCNALVCADALTHEYMTTTPAIPDLSALDRRSGW